VSPEPNLSVVIPTHNRADLLKRVLESYARQGLPLDEYEIVVVDDGSSDGTEDVCRKLRSQLPLSYIQIAHAGSAAAKNSGLAAARGKLIVFSDDDDIADAGLLRAHLVAHAEHPAPTIAILGFGKWHPELTLTPLMHYATEVGQVVSSYPQLRHGDVLDFRYFWVGRISSKRELLLSERGFDERFSALEDIEFGYRLSQRGLQIIFDQRPLSFMARPIDYDGFCLRCERMGAALIQFRGLHASESVDAYARMMLGGRASALEGVATHGDVADLDHELARLRERTSDLEGELDQVKPGAGAVAGFIRQRRLKQLYRLYGEAFRLSTLKGALMAMVAGAR
jgi:glycosyltransferase involved in cell wall biosynthesis